MNTTSTSLSASPRRTVDQISFFVIVGLIVFGAFICLASMLSLQAGNTSAGYSAPKLFNQANAYAHDGKTGLAVAFYERARLLAPHDPDIAANLHWVREHAGLSEPVEGWQDHVLSTINSNTLALFGALGLIFLGTGLLSARFLSRLRSFSFLGIGAGIVLLAISLFGAFVAWQTSHQAIITATETPARISPVSNGETSFSLHAGEIVSIQGAYHDFLLVQNGKCQSGWVSQGEMTPLIPNS